ncbi:uncharacterized protein LOC121180820 isoform X2 [Toxotes jaculatrix]|uniref:uncharacterized protein LOC121180820 isoform X2 n=1 Tax=Toxotes jaculatrix TaxID=941984 RepID=UPI001B3ABAF8|nr:uncharacterized protein LOC121180820 isoform X2 [Toxotes jaculatrix]
MDGQQIFLFVLLGLASCSHDWISGSVSEMTFGAGDNITLYCDCKSSTGVYIVWYRNCSHVNQPSLVLKTMLQPDAWKHKTEADILNPLPRFHLVWNSSSESYDLQIMNITDLDEGLYYCGTEQSRLETLTPHYVYQYGNTTRILIKLIVTASCFIQTPVCLINMRLHETVVCAGGCCSLSVQLLLFSLLSSPPSLFITFVKKQLKDQKPAGKDLTTETKQGGIRMKMCVMLHWKSVRHHRDLRRRKLRVQTSPLILPSTLVRCKRPTTLYN